MKNLKHLFTALLLFYATVTTARNLSVGGIDYYITSTTNFTVEVSSNSNNQYSGDVVIPESVTYNGYTYRVTSIGGSAFNGCSGLKSVTIPNCVTSIGRSAFYGCSGLTSITIPNYVTSIGEYAFEGCSGLTSITIPNYVTSIGKSAFKNCTKLKTVLNLSSLTFSRGASANGYIAYYADKVINAPYGTIEGDYVWTNAGGVKTLAYYMGNATKLVLPSEDANYTIGADAFNGCSGLKSVTIPNCVTSIGMSAFEGCSGLTSITIPNSVTSIDPWAFNGCKNLKTVLNLSSLTFSKGSVDNGYVAKYADKVINAPNGTIEGDYMWVEVSGVKTLAYYMGNATGLVLPSEDINYTIGADAFNGCSDLKSVTIPNSVTSIGGGAFNGCSDLKSVTIPNSVTSIGGGAFYGCSGLTSITIPNSVTSIGESAFEGCSGLTSVTIPNSVTSIGERAFYSCSRLTSVTIPNSVTSIGERAFYGCSRLTSVTIPNSITSIARAAFYDCTRLKSVFNFSSLTLSKGSDSNGYVAYYANKVINAPNGTIEGDYVWDQINGVKTLACYMGSATELVLPSKDANYAIGVDAFNGCSGLKSITIPNCVTSIGESAFENCSGLTSITIPNSVTSIANKAFNGCYALKELRIEDGEMLIGGYHTASTNIGKGLFFDCPLESVYLGRTFHYNSSKSCGYSPFYNNTTLTNVIIGNSVTNIEPNEFYNCSSLTSVTIPNSVTSIEGSAFWGCKKLTRIVIPNSVKSIDDYAFNECSNLTSVTIPDSVTSIGIGAFSDCSSLASIVIPNSVTSIGDNAFESCSGLTSVVIGNSIKSIGDKAFYNCKKIKEIKVGKEMPISGNANIFADVVYDNAKLYIPNGTKSFYDKREPWNLFFYIIEMDFTDIDEVKGENEEMEGIYDLSGRRITEITESGLYIINGKKVLIK